MFSVLLFCCCHKVPEDNDYDDYMYIYCPIKREYNAMDVFTVFDGKELDSNAYFRC